MGTWRGSGLRPDAFPLFWGSRRPLGSPHSSAILTQLCGLPPHCCAGSAGRHKVAPTSRTHGVGAGPGRSLFAFSKLLLIVASFLLVGARVPLQPRDALNMGARTPRPGTAATAGALAWRPPGDVKTRTAQKVPFEKRTREKKQLERTCCLLCV